MSGFENLVLNGVDGGTRTDIYMLVDLSGSFSDDLPNFQAQAGTLYSTRNTVVVALAKDIPRSSFSATVVVVATVLLVVTDDSSGIGSTVVSRVPAGDDEELTRIMANTITTAPRRRGAAHKRQCVFKNEIMVFCAS